MSINQFSSLFTKAINSKCVSKRFAKDITLHYIHAQNRWHNVVRPPSVSIHALKTLKRFSIRLISIVNASWKRLPNICATGSFESAKWRCQILDFSLDILKLISIKTGHLPYAQHVQRWCYFKGFNFWMLDSRCRHRLSPSSFKAWKRKLINYTTNKNQLILTFLF